MYLRAFLAVLAVLALPARADDLPQYPFLYVTGSATKAVVPDTATASFVVRARDANAANAEQLVAQCAREVLALLKDNGIAPADIDAHEISKVVAYERDSYGMVSGAARHPTAMHYVLSRGFAVRLRRLESWPAVGSKLLQMQNIEELDVKFDRSDHDALRAQLMSDAAQDARRRAEAMAAGFAQQLGPVQGISPGPFRDIHWDMLASDSRGGAMAGGQQRDAVALLVPDTISIEVEVHALYRLGGASR